MFDARAKYAFIAAMVTLVASGAGFEAAVRKLKVILQKQPIELRRDLASIPRRIGDWEAIDDMQLDAASVESLGSDKYLLRRYRNTETDLVVMFQVVYYTGMIDAVPHIPQRCFVAAGMQTLSSPADLRLEVDFASKRVDHSLDDQRGSPYWVIEVPHPVTGRVEDVYLPTGDWDMRTARFKSLDGQELFAGYFFVANNRLTPSPERIRALAFSPQEQYAYFAKVEVMMFAPSGEGIEWFQSTSTSLVRDIAPHLMRCLPDWSEVVTLQNGDARSSDRS